MCEGRTGPFGENPHNMCLYYVEGINRFVGEMGEIVDNIHKYVTPSQIMLFKSKKECMAFIDASTHSYIIELIYPDPYENREDI